MADRDQRRPLSRFRLGRRGQRARPFASACGRGDHRAGQEGHPRLQPLSHPRRRAAGRPAVRYDLRRQGVFRQFRRRGDGRRHQDGAEVPVRQRPSRALPHHHLRGLVPRPHARRRWRPPRTRSISTASARPMDGFDQVPLGDIEAVKRAITPETAGIIIEPVQGEGGVRSAPPQFFRALRQLCDEQRPAARVRRGADRHRPARRDVRLSEDRRDARRDGARQGPRRRLPDRRGAGHRGSRQGHDARHPRLDLRRQSAGDGGRQRRARRGDEAGLPRSRPQHRAAVQAAPRRDQGPASVGDRRGARRRAADRAEVRRFRTAS